MKISAVIFDLDGTVIDSEGAWGKAFRKVFKKLGVDIADDHPQIGGIGIKANWEILLPRYKIQSSKSLDELENLTQQEFMELLPEVTLSEGVEEFIMGLRKLGIKTALATSSNSSVVERIFDKLHMKNLFDSTITGDEVVDKKPKPDLFLKAADRLGVAPEECLVIEDAVSGIEAAHEAAMKVVGFARDETHARTLGRAERVVSSFSELSDIVT